MANKDSFKPIEFGPGFNVVLADRTPEATRTDSRNARGKSSLLAAINYCLGGNFPSEFEPLAAEAWEFKLRLQIAGSIVDVSRSCAAPRTRVTVAAVDGPTPAWVSLASEEGTLSVEAWKEVLGWGLFGIPDASGEEDARLSSRTLLSYLIRRAAPDDPTKFMAQQSARSSRLHMAYLFGLSWGITHQLAELKEEQNVYKAVDTAAASKFLSGVVGNEADLLIERREAILARDRMAERARDFILLDDPDDLVAQADRLTSQVNVLRNDAFVARRMIALYEQSLEEAAQAASDGTLALLQQELAQAITENARRRFDEVAEFHNRVYENRSNYLSHELDVLRANLLQAERQVSISISTRTGVLEQISAGGVLEELLAIQRSIVELDSQIRDLDNQVDALRRWARAREDLSVTKGALRVQASGVLEEKQPDVDRFAARFDSLIRSLYGKGGALTVKVDDDGYKINLTVASSSSTGVRKMKLFSFDLTLLAEADPDVHPKFLVHDSVVFDGVDPVQTQTALESVQALAAESAHGNFQYIAMLNSNEVPDELAEADWFVAGVRRRILENEVGGAFGVLF